MRMTLLTSAAILGFALALPAFAQTATDPNPANPSAVKDSTVPASGTGSGAAPGNDPATSGQTGATLGNHAPQQDPGPMGATTNPSPADSSSGTGSTPPSSAAGADQETPTATAPSRPHHRRMSRATTGTGDDASGETGHWSHQPGTGMSGPASSQASNIDSADTHSTIAPHLPEPKLGMNAGPDGYLRAADRALAAHKTGAAQQALEMAETRLLDRSTNVGDTGPDQNPRIAAVSAARKALADKDWKGARKSIQEAMNTGSTGAGEGSTTGDSGSAMSPGANTGGMQNGMSSGSGSVGTVSPTPNPGNSSPPVNPTGAGPDGTHAIGTGNGGGALGTTTNDSAGGAK
jgi:hypothetical protein